MTSENFHDLDFLRDGPGTLAAQTIPFGRLLAACKQDASLPVSPCPIDVASNLVADRVIDLVLRRLRALYRLGDQHFLRKSTVMPQRTGSSIPL